MCPTREHAHARTCTLVRTAHASAQVVEAESAKDPEMMPYFFLQSDDYITLKERATAHILSGKPGAPEGMATIDIAVEALKCAEYLTPLLTNALKA